MEHRVVRIHVGGLGEAVTEEELRRMFELAGAGGSVHCLQFVRTKGRSFAYVDFSPSSDNSLNNLFAKYNGCVWKGRRLRLEKAKEHYLNRLKREWAEDAAAAAAKGADGNRAAPDFPEVPRNIPIAEKTNLRMFFPRLRKVKLLPFSGTGKHKYSFQHVDMPSLPKYFCDCEEHSSSFSAEKQKQLHHQKVESGGMNHEELSIMNKVMDALFQKRNGDSIDNGTLLVDTGDNSFKLNDDLHYDEDEADEDNLILNVVTKGNKDMLTLLGRQPGLQVNDQGTRSKRQPSQDGFTVQNGNDSEPPNKKKKSLSHDKSSRKSQKSKDNDTPNKKEKPLTRDKSRRKEIESTVYANANNGMGKGATVQPIEAESGKRKSSVHVCYQKSLWKELVGDIGSNRFSIFSRAPNIASTEEDLQKSNAANVPDADNKKGDLERNVIASTEEGQQRSEAPNELESNSRHDNLERDGESKGMSHREEMEGLVKGQPADSNVALTHTGRGASWQHKSSWMQLIGGNTSFSISPLFGGAPSDQRLLIESKVLDVVIPANDQLNEIEDSAGDVLSFSETENKDVSRTIRADKQQTILGNDEAPMLMLEENCGVAAKETSASKVEISDTCSFIRNATSLKEWAKTKAALSGLLKRKRNEQK